MIVLKWKGNVKKFKIKKLYDILKLKNYTHFCMRVQKCAGIYYI